MRVFITQDQTAYRRWINVLLSLLLPGSAQFLSGRKIAGITWFFANLALELSLLIIGIFTAAFSSPWLMFGDLPFTFFLILDACRKPIPRMEKKKWFKFLKIYALVVIVIPVCLALLVRQFLIHPFMVPTGSMQPTIMGITTDNNGNKLPGDRIVVNKTAYWKHPPQRGDIIVFKTKGINHPLVKPSTFYIKRIVGLPGETVSIRPPEILINGQPVTEPDILNTIMKGQNGYSGYTLAADTIQAILTDEDKSITLADDEYLEIGDNSPQSLDGRYYGPIKRSSILGKVIYRYAPSNRKGWIE